MRSTKAIINQGHVTYCFGAVRISDKKIRVFEVHASTRDIALRIAIDQNPGYQFQDDTFTSKNHLSEN